MTDTVFVSICIPAYKNVSYLERLFNSISSQTFKDYEVIISDDSPDSSVDEFVGSFKGIKNLKYFRNENALGTPENWNHAIRKSKGKWIKLMHDDDWFIDEFSLQHFVDLILEYPLCSFFYSAYINVDIAHRKYNKIRSSWLRRFFLESNPATLFSKNIIGPPSVVIYKRDQNVEYDRNLKWLVDIDFYIRYLKPGRGYYCNKFLINIGLSELQVTRESSMVREVEIPEYFKVLNKIGVKSLESILVYDAWWRMIRNMSVSNLLDIREAGYFDHVPDRILHIISFQSKLANRLLHFGPTSKFFMIVSYVTGRLIYDKR